MSASDTSPRLARFEDFGLDLQTGELRRDGNGAVRLACQPFQILVLLLKHSGDVVPREELRKRLWPNDTIVEFEHSIDAAINKLRQALGDSADKPRFIETFARRGYRWMIPVEWVETGRKETVGTPTGVAEQHGIRQGLIGKRVSHYRILEVLGGGGMGVVYKAEDLKLGRCVALKFLGEELIGDHRALERFEREARTISALDHPNICTIHEVSEHAGQPFIVMQLLQGKTLRQRIESADAEQLAFTQSELLDFGIQIVEGLEAAHQKGILHRDVKPANIFITNRGEIKLLDFGLAKLMDAGGVHSEVTRSQADAGPIAAVNLAMGAQTSVSLTGAVMGTASYMSPEHVRKEKLDARSDLFSFGVVLYEMATGHQPFRGDNLDEIHDAVLSNNPPSPLAWNPSLPMELETIVGKALEKDREKRYQSAGEIICDLKRVQLAAPGRSAADQEDRAPLPAETSRRSWGKLVSALAASGMLVAIGFSVVQLRHGSHRESKLLNFVRVTGDSRAKEGPLVTDGSRIYMTELLPGWRQLLVQVPQKGGDTAAFPTSLKEPHVQDIAPDGSELLVLGNDGPGLWLVPVAGGSPRRVGTSVAYDASWHPNGKLIVYSAGHEIFVVQKDGSLTRKLLAVSGYVMHLRFSPDGRSIRFTMLDEAHQSTSLWEASADGRDLRRLLAGWNEPAKECCGRWTPDGRYYIFQAERDGRKNIWALPEKNGFFSSSNETPRQLTAGPMNFTDPIPSKDGKQLLAIGVFPRAEVVRYDVHTGEFVPYLSSVSAEGLDFSKTGEWVTYTSYPDGTLWRCRADGSDKRQLTFSPLRAFSPRWSPDAKQIAFMGMLPGKQWKINIVSAEGGAPLELFPDDEDEADPSWLPDGNTIAYGRGPWTSNPAVDIRIVNLQTHEISKVVGSDGLFSPRCSPDGRYIVALKMKEPRTPLLFDFRNRRWEKLPGSNMGSPNWSASGKYIYLQDWSTPNDRMVRVRLSDRKLENIAAFESIGGLGLGTIIAWTGVAPDDSPLLARDVSAEEIYAFDWNAP